MKNLFTLIELIVVIAVLGVLAAIVVPNISSFQDEATDTAMIADARNLQTSVDMYALDNYGSYPSVEQPKVGDPKIIDYSLLKPKYLRDTPKTGAKYWVDYRGKVWFSSVDSPTGINNNAGALSWNNSEGATTYRVYEVEEGSTSAVSLDKLKLRKEVEGLSLSVGDSKTYLVSAVDTNGFESAPVGSTYKGYPKEGVVALNDTLTCENLKGEGTEVNPYKISNANELNAVRHCLTAHFELISDIDMSIYGPEYNVGQGWIPIGESSNMFIGTLNGNNHTILNLYVKYEGSETSKYHKGLFGYIGNVGVVKNLIVSEASVQGFNHIGIITGNNYGLIDNVHITGTMTASGWTGGIAGYNYNGGKLLNSTSSVQIKGGSYIGGLVGFNYGLIEGSSSNDSLIDSGQSGGQYVGGTVGNNYGSIENSFSTNSILKSSQWVGGLVGMNQEMGSIRKSYSTNQVNATTGTIGGLVGMNYGLIEESYATGDAIVPFNMNRKMSIGGLVGLNTGTGIVRNSYSTGNAIGDSTTDNVGGFIGSDYGNVYNSYSTGQAFTDKSSLGGFTGVKDSTKITSSSFWDTQTSTLSTSVSGTGKTTAEMKQQATFSGWDFNAVWKIEEGQDYPKLQWENK